MLSPSPLDDVFAGISRNGKTRVFMPVCIYTRNLTQSQKVRAVIDALSRNGLQCAFVIADDLHAYSMQIRGYRRSTAETKAAITGENLLKMMQKLIARTGASNIAADRWNGIAGDSQFAT